MNSIDKCASEFEKGISLSKCQKCGCMKGALEEMRNTRKSANDLETSKLLKKVESWLGRTEPALYTWLGCKHCYPAVAINEFHEAFPESEGSSPISCGIEMPTASWPPVAGEYFLLPENQNGHIAVSTLASVFLAESLANMKPKGLCIAGKTETENIGIDKIIKNTVVNPSINTLVLTGIDPEGHRSGATLLSLCEQGVDDSMRVIGSPGKHPFLKNVTKEEVEAFRNQIKVVDMIGCEDVKQIVKTIKKVASLKHPLSCSKKDFSQIIRPVKIQSVEVILAEKSKKVGLDRAGYFVILPLRDRGSISVEHYSTDNRLLRIIEGKDSADIYRTIIMNKWVTQMSHAAYLGKELARAELSMTMNFKYIQDGA